MHDVLKCPEIIVALFPLSRKLVCNYLQISPGCKSLFIVSLCSVLVLYMINFLVSWASITALLESVGLWCFWWLSLLH